jgi:hypothetical protein
MTHCYIVVAVLTLLNQGNLIHVTILYMLQAVNDKYFFIMTERIADACENRVGYTWESNDFMCIYKLHKHTTTKGVLGVVTHLIQPVLPNRQAHLSVAYPVSNEALTPKSQQDNCFISAEGNADTHTVCPEALKVATLPLDYHSHG